MIKNNLTKKDINKLKDLIKDYLYDKSDEWLYRNGFYGYECRGGNYANNHMVIYYKKQYHLFDVTIFLTDDGLDNIDIEYWSLIQEVNGRFYAVGVVDKEPKLVKALNI